MWTLWWFSEFLTLMFHTARDDFIQRNVPHNLAPCLLIQSRLILTNIHHSNWSACTEVVITLIVTYKHLYPSLSNRGGHISYWDSPILECSQKKKSAFTFYQDLLCLLFIKKTGCQAFCSKKIIILHFCLTIFLPLAFNSLLISYSFYNRALLLASAASS